MPEADGNLMGRTILSARDSREQQAIFDRLPLSPDQKRAFLKHLQKINKEELDARVAQARYAEAAEGQVEEQKEPAEEPGAQHAGVGREPCDGNAELGQQAL